MKNKMFVIIYVLIIASMISLSGNTQNDDNHLGKYEGTWSYKEDQVDYTVMLVSKKITIHESREEIILIGFSKLIVNGEILYDNLNSILKFKDRDIVERKEIFDTRNPENIPNLLLRFSSNELYGTLTGDNKLKGVNLTSSIENNKLIWNFLNFVSKREIDADHIPAVPSTWVLKRVEE